MDIDRRELRVVLDRSASPVAFEILTADQAAAAAPRGAMRIANLSRTGMFIEGPGAAEALAMGTSLQFALRFDGDDDHVTGVARVKWVRAKELGPYQPKGLGVQVVEFHDNAERRYLEFLEARLLQLKITDLMDPNFVGVPPAVAVKQVVTSLTQKKAGAAVVVDEDGAALGIFSFADLARLTSRGASLHDSVGLHMTPGPHALSVDQTIDAAYDLMRHGAIGHFPVVEEETVVGLLSTGDLLRHWAEFTDLQARRLSRAYDRAMALIAHDLRTPISLVASTNAMLTSGEITPQEYVDSGFPEILDQSCDTMMHLIDDILDIGRLTQGAVRLEKRVVDVADLVERVARAFVPAAQGKSIDLRISTGGALPRITADPIRLEQVLNNLVSNALKYSPEGSKVVIGAKTNHSRVVIWVSDNGPGIAPDELGRLFKEFGRTSNRPTKGEKSVGLGLAITRRLVEAHGGDIGVESKPGLGTTFTVTLPIGDIQ
jgi:signal transduction histidine kinase